MKEAGDYTVHANMATNADDVGIQLFIDDVAVTDTILAAKGEDWSTYSSVAANISGLTAGEHVLKMVIVGNYVNIDYLNFVKGKDAPEDGPTTDSTTDMRKALRVEIAGPRTYGIYDLGGRFVGKVSMDRSSAASALRAKGFKPAVYIVREVRGRETFMVNVAK